VAGACNECCIKGVVATTIQHRCIAQKTGTWRQRASCCGGPACERARARQQRRLGQVVTTCQSSSDNIRQQQQDRRAGGGPARLYVTPPSCWSLTRPCLLPRARVQPECCVCLVKASRSVTCQGQTAHDSPSRRMTPRGAGGRTPRLLAGMPCARRALALASAFALALALAEGAQRPAQRIEGTDSSSERAGGGPALLSLPEECSGLFQEPWTTTFSEEEASYWSHDATPYLCEAALQPPATQTQALPPGTTTPRRVAPVRLSVLGRTRVWRRSELLFREAEADWL